MSDIFPSNAEAPILFEYDFLELKLKFYMDNKTKITFRLRDMPEYFYTGIIFARELVLIPCNIVLETF